MCERSNVKQVFYIHTHYNLRGEGKDGVYTCILWGREEGGRCGGGIKSGKDKEESDFAILPFFHGSIYIEYKI